MNALDRSLIEKAGYDNGWEVVLLSISTEVRLASSLHNSEARISPSPTGKWLLTLPPGKLLTELNRHRDPANSSNAFEVGDDGELGRLLLSASKIARTLPNAPVILYHQKITEILEDSQIDKTEVERLVKQRVGQEVFRDTLIDYWGGRCAVTGIAVPELLRASHIKPWADCDSDGERLNVFNGLLLCAHLDALFDRHLMTFDTEGKLQFADSIPTGTLTKLGIDPDWKLRWKTDEHEKFLKIHRQNFIE